MPCIKAKPVKHVHAMDRLRSAKNDTPRVILVASIGCSPRGNPLIASMSYSKHGDRSVWFYGVVQYVVLRHGTGFVHNIVSFLGGGNTFSLPDNKFTLWVGKWKSRCKKVKSCCEEDFFQSFPTEHFPAQDRVRILPLPLVCCRLQRREKRHSTRGTEKLIEYKTYLQALPYSDRSEGDRPTKPTTPCSSLSALAGEKYLPPEAGLVVPVFQKGDDPIDAINHMMSFLTSVVASRYPATNNQLRTSSNPRQQATINNDRVTIQPIQGRQNYVLAGSSRPFTSGQGGAQGKQRVITCYNCK
nr:NADH dehydrogenase subunit 7, mitochondrial [Tanacetum cinerariifolium]